MCRQYDGTTGAEFFFEGTVISKIVLHFVDGERGDHDLERNGVIVTRGGVLSQAAPILYPLQISSANLFSGVGTSNYSDRNASINLFHYLKDGTLQEGFNNPAFTSLYAGRQVAELATEVFDFTPTGEVTGWIRQVSDQSNLSGLLLIGGSREPNSSTEWFPSSGVTKSSTLRD